MPEILRFLLDLLILVAAFACNIPLGVWREQTPRFSAKWFFWIFASVPLVIVLGLALEGTAGVILLSIVPALAGQAAGGRSCRGQMTREQREAMAQIPPLLLQPARGVSDNDVLVALLNMGGPRTNAGVKDFLHRIFLDPYIIRFPFSRILQPFFAWMIVTLRAKAAAERYRLIGGASPIFEATKAQAAELEKELERRGRKITVTFSFNYSSPLPEETVGEARRLGKKHLLPLSLYPHYSKATTGSNLHYLEKAARALAPDLVFLNAPPYYLHDGYIRALTDRVREALGPEDRLEDYYLLFSAHGLPLYFLTEGDPYPFQIAQTTARVLAGLGRAGDWAISYQSDVGPLQWLKPSTEHMLTALAVRGVRRVLVVPVSFVTDHIETLCEIDIEYRKLAEEAGIQDFKMSRAVECHPGFIGALADAVEQILPKA